MALRKELTLNWQGKPFKLLVTMLVIDKIEDSINIGRLLAQHATGDIRFSHVARFISLLLNEAGAEVTQEEVYSGMFTDGDITAANLHVFMGNVFEAFFPEPKKKEPTTTTPKKRKSRAKT
jgi:hypothetical protein